LRGKEQIKSAFIFGQESTASQMLVFGKYLSLLDKEFDFAERIKAIENVTIDDVHEAISKSFDIENSATATVGPKRSALKI
jgi:predicted Zn-dependent peptidase